MNRQAVVIGVGNEFVHGVEAGEVGPGTGLTPAVAAAAVRLAAAVLGALA